MHNIEQNHNNAYQMLKNIERQPGKKSQFSSSPLSASVSVMLGAAVTTNYTNGYGLRG